MPLVSDYAGALCIAAALAVIAMSTASHGTPRGTAAMAQLDRDEVRVMLRTF